MAASDVASLVSKLRSNIDSIHTCIQSLSDFKPHDDAISRLEADREAQSQELQTPHEIESRALEAQRENEATELDEK